MLEHPPALVIEQHPPPMPEHRHLRRVEDAVTDRPPMKLRIQPPPLDVVQVAPMAKGEQVRRRVVPRRPRAPHPSSTPMLEVGHRHMLPAPHALVPIPLEHQPPSPFRHPRHQPTPAFRFVLPDSGCPLLLTRPVRSPLLGRGAASEARGTGKRFGGATSKRLSTGCGFCGQTLWIITAYPCWH